MKSTLAATLLLLVFSACTAPDAARFEDVSITRFGKIVDGTGEVLDAREIAVRGGRIIAVGDDLAAEYLGAASRELEGLTALPGLIDAHVHITYALPEPAQGDAWAELSQATPEELFEGAKINARKTLGAGVTSARDLFGAEGVDFALREAIEAGEVIGPRLYLSGVGLHPQTLEGIEEGAARDVVTEFAAVARARARQGADWVKIFATSGSADDLTAEQYFFYPEIKAAVDAAHAAGLKVAVHAYGPSAVPDALRAGVDSIDHAVDLSDDLIARWAKTDVIYVPTIDHNRYYADRRAEYGYDEETARKLRAFVRRNVETLRRMHASGITVAMGSDALMSGFGENARELEWFIEAGLSPAEAIEAATVGGARLLGEEDFLGRIKEGFAADVIAVEGDPLADIRAITENVRWVMKAGEIVVDKTGS